MLWVTIFHLLWKPSYVPVSKYHMFSTVIWLTDTCAYYKLFQDAKYIFKINLLIHKGKIPLIFVLWESAVGYLRIKKNIQLLCFFVWTYIKSFCNI